eukprot:SAG25_NODE_463_length_7790_cov_6.841654_1_plen_1126_part_00
MVRAFRRLAKAAHLLFYDKLPAKVSERSVVSLGSYSRAVPEVLRALRPHLPTQVPHKSYQAWVPLCLKGHGSPKYVVAQPLPPEKTRRDCEQDSSTETAKWLQWNATLEVDVLEKKLQKKTLAELRALCDKFGVDRDKTQENQENKEAERRKRRQEKEGAEEEEQTRERREKTRYDEAKYLRARLLDVLKPVKPVTSGLPLRDAIILRRLAEQMQLHRVDIKLIRARRANDDPVWVPESAGFEYAHSNSAEAVKIQLQKKTDSVPHAADPDKLQIHMHNGSVDTYYNAVEVSIKHNNGPHQMGDDNKDGEGEPEPEPWKISATVDTTVRAAATPENAGGIQTIEVTNGHCLDQTAPISSRAPFRPDEIGVDERGREWTRVDEYREATRAVKMLEWKTGTKTLGWCGKLPRLLKHAEEHAKKHAEEHATKHAETVQNCGWAVLLVLLRWQDGQRTSLHRQLAHLALLKNCDPTTLRIDFCDDDSDFRVKESGRVDGIDWSSDTVIDDKWCRFNLKMHGNSGKETGAFQLYTAIYSNRRAKEYMRIRCAVKSHHARKKVETALDYLVRHRSPSATYMYGPITMESVLFDWRMKSEHTVPKSTEGVNAFIEQAEATLRDGDGMVWFPVAAAETDLDGDLPLHFALRCKSPEPIVRSVLRAFPGAAAIESDTAQTPLCLALQNGYSDEIVHELLKEYPNAAQWQSSIDLQFQEQVQASTGFTDLEKDFGVTEQEVNRALRATGNEGVKAALDYIVERRCGTSMALVLLSKLLTDDESGGKPRISDLHIKSHVRGLNFRSWRSKPVYGSWLRYWKSREHSYPVGLRTMTEHSYTVIYSSQEEAELDFAKLCIDFNVKDRQVYIDTQPALDYLVRYHGGPIIVELVCFTNSCAHTMPEDTDAKVRDKCAKCVDSMIQQAKTNKAYPQESLFTRALKDLKSKYGITGHDRRAEAEAEDGKQKQKKRRWDTGKPPWQALHYALRPPAPHGAKQTGRQDYYPRTIKVLLRHNSTAVRHAVFLDSKKFSRSSPGTLPLQLALLRRADMAASLHALENYRQQVWLVLQAYPAAASKVDECGRLPLHTALMTGADAIICEWLLAPTPETCGSAIAAGAAWAWTRRVRSCRSPPTQTR